MERVVSHFSGGACETAVKTVLASHGLLDRGFHVGGAHHHVPSSVQDDTLPGPFVHEQHLAFSCHDILLSHRLLH